MTQERQVTGDTGLPMLKPSCLADAARSRTKDDTPTCKEMSCAQDVSRDKLAQWHRQGHQMPEYANSNVKWMHTRRMPQGAGATTALGISEACTSEGTLGQGMGFSRRAYPVKRKCCGEGTVTSTDDDHVPLGELVHSPGHAILKGFWVSLYVVQYSSFSVTKVVLLKGLEALCTQTRQGRPPLPSTSVTARC